MFQGVDAPLKAFEAERSWIDDASVAMDLSALGEGIDVAENSRDKAFQQFNDYEENEQYYKAYADNRAWYKVEEMENTDREIIDLHVESGRFTLAEDGKITDARDGQFNELLFDMDMVKGAILAKRNGWTKETANTAYANYTKEESLKLSTKLQGASVSARISGSLANLATDPIMLAEMALSPQRVMGKNIVGGMAKAFSIEALIGMGGETTREQSRIRHAEMANIDYTLWDSVQNILIAGGFAGTIRAVGSGLVDLKTTKNIIKNIKNKDLAQGEIVERWFRIEGQKLTNSTTKHFDILNKAESDINKGKQVDVSGHTDIDINTKVDDAVEEINMLDEVALDRASKSIDNDIEQIVKEVDEVPEVTDDIFEGMATEKEADELFNEISADDADFKAELEEIEQQIIKEKRPLTDRQNEIKDAKSVEIGGSEEDAKEKVKQFFKPNNSDEARFKSMNKEDIAELERMHNADKNTPFIAEEIKQSIVEAEADGIVFAKGGDNLLTGTIAGVEEDENGNITFNPEKFVLGLGGYTALKKIITSPTIKKEFKEYVGRVLDELESNPKFNYITGRSNIIDNGDYKMSHTSPEPEGANSGSVKNLPKPLQPKVAKVIDKTTRDKNFKKWFNGSKIVNEDGSPKVVYHQTSEEAERNIMDTEFNINKGKARLSDNAVPDGIFFKPNTKDIGVGGDVQIPVFLDIKKPLNVGDREELKSLMSKYSPEYKKLLTSQGEIDIKYSKLLDEAEKEYDDFAKKSYDYKKMEYKKSSKREMDKLSDGLDSILEEWKIEQSEIPTKARAVINLYLKEKGFDGLIIKNDIGSFGRSTETIIALIPNQIKSVNNKGAFSKDGNILKGALTIPAVGLATSQQKETN